MQTPAILFSDYDGTFLPSGQPVPESHYQALKRLKSMGVLFVFVTGRSRYSFDKSQFGVGLADYYAFSSGGTLVDAQGNPLYQRGFERDEALLIAEELKRQGLSFMLHHPFPDNHHFLSYEAPGSSHIISPRLDVYSAFVTDYHPYLIPHGAAQFLIEVKHEKAELAFELQKQFSTISVVRATSPLDHRFSWIELFPSGVSKALPVHFLTSHLGINLTDTAATGNDYNDRELFSIAAISAGIRGIPNNIKTTYLTNKKCHEGGFKEAIDLLFPIS